MLWRFGSGPAVARLFGSLFAIVSLVAWLSLGDQLAVLIGSDGLLPAEDFVAAVRGEAGLSPLDLPTVFWWGASDTALRLGVAAGVGLSIAALLGFGRRVCFALSTALYLSYAVVARDFLSFQWDNLLLECGLLATFLPPGRAAPVVHLLFRVLLFKLYFESGVAKWGSSLHDWHDGSAMTYYYETAPLPTWLAYRAHHLPAWWHHVESRATLVVELALPFAIFGPRRARLFAAAAFTLFQIGNAGTANYGFFCYLAVALHAFLLDDADVDWARARLARALRRRAPAPAAEAPAAAAAIAVSVAKWTAAGVYLLVSWLSAVLHFGTPGPVVTAAAPLLDGAERLRVVNTYHLFASITRDRIEPELQTDAGDGVWTPQHLRHKPGDPWRAPDFVAPHQPRVDFQLWFYGLSFQRREPRYVATLVERLCEHPAAVQPLFRAPLPAAPAAVRIVFWKYQFTSPAEAKATGAWWRRSAVAESRAVPCPRAP